MSTQGTSPSPTLVSLILEPKPGKVVTASILTASRDCLLAVDGGGIGSPDFGPGATALRTDVTSPVAYDVFTIVRKENDPYSFALKTVHDYYVSAACGGGMGAEQRFAFPLPILTDGNVLEPSSAFHIVLLGEDKVRIGTPDRKHFVTASKGGGVFERGDPIRTDAKSPGDNEWFQLVVFELQSQTHNGLG